jgi:phosphoglucomutase
LVSAYYTGKPDPSIPEQQVAFGTSGHRGSSLKTAFNEDHILAVTQALVEYRREAGHHRARVRGHRHARALGPARDTALEVLAAARRRRVHRPADGYTPTPAVSSFAILEHNRGRSSGLADGIVITPSHNPPEDGGFKYNPPNGGPPTRRHQA